MMESSSNHYGPFVYDESLLKECAMATTMKGNDVSSSSSSSCHQLYQSYRKHYQKSKDDDDSYSYSQSWHRFMETVQRVYQHGRSHQDTDTIVTTRRPRYQITLNQFADQPPLVASYDSTSPNDENNDDDDPWWMEHLLPNGTLSNDSEHHLRRRYRSLSQAQDQSPPSTMMQVLDSEASILFQSKRTQKTQHHSIPQIPLPEEFPLPYDDQDPQHPQPFTHKDPFATLELPSSADGIELDLVLPPSSSSSSFPKPKQLKNKNKNNDSLQSQQQQQPPFHSFLNWATTDNPDGVPLVHNVFDQGDCGSCWAFAATGTVEASAARNAAREAYHNELQRLSDTRPTTNKNDDGGNVDAHQNVTQPQQPHYMDALHYAQFVETAVFHQTNLSIQELLDCDTVADQGCTGGNPLLAFFYIHRHGLASWEEYPYVGHEDTCQHHHGGSSSRNQQLPPLATVQSWGVLPKNYEYLIELALLHIGPVAVGINGADPDFISYQGGIYDKTTCDQGANHAMLIVGYGQEEENYEDDEVEEYGSVHGAVDESPPQRRRREPVRYWIARNSWGAHWGEKGYARILRGSGEKKVPGICGIARSPSVALGGQFHRDRSSWEDWMDPIYKKKHHQHRHSDVDDDGRLHYIQWPVCHRLLPVLSWEYRACVHVARFFDGHRAFSLGIISIICALVLAVWPLSLECRRRTSQPRRRKRPRRRPSPPSGTVSTSGSHASTLQTAAEGPQHDDEEGIESDKDNKSREALAGGGGNSIPSETIPILFLDTPKTNYGSNNNNGLTTTAGVSGSDSSPGRDNGLVGSEVHMRA